MTKFAERVKRYSPEYFLGLDLGLSQVEAESLARRWSLSSRGIPMDMVEEELRFWREVSEESAYRRTDGLSEDRI